jgi:DNA-binding NarL/FixJ family response regulator
MAAQGAGEAVRRCAAALAERAPGAGQREALSALAHALGEVALLDGDAATAADRFESALAELDRLEIPWDRALTALRAGVAHAAAGDGAAARRRLQESLEAARRLGARPLAARVAVELRALDGQPPTAGEASAAAHGLTRRERQVLQRVAAGRTNREIAAELVLSPRTIEMHVQNALGKLGCRSRAEASARAATLGLLDDAVETP